jgi:hypothetical protein
MPRDVIGNRAEKEANDSAVATSTDHNEVAFGIK